MFIGRPNFPEGLAQLALQTDRNRPDPMVAAFQAISDVVNNFGKLRHEKVKKDRDVADRRALFEQATDRAKGLQDERLRMALTSALTKEGRLSPYQAPVPFTPAAPAGFQGFGTPNAMGPTSANDRPGVLLSELLSSGGIKLPPGAADFRVLPPSQKSKTAEAKPGVVPLTSQLISQVKDVVDLSEFADQGYTIPVSVIGSLRNQARLWKDSGGGKGMTSEQRMKMEAARMAFREYLQAQNDPMIVDKESIPPWEQTADEYYSYLTNQGGETQQPALADLFMQSILSEASR